MGEAESIKKKLKLFKSRANNNMRLQRMILFGSRVKGKKGKDVDIDLVIVSSQFKNLDFFERGAKMYDYWNLDYPVDFLCYTPEEFNKLKKQITIVREAVREGIEI